MNTRGITDSSPVAGLQRPNAPIEVDASKAALLVIDLQYFDAHRDWGEGLTAKTLGLEDRFETYFQRIDQILPNVSRLLEAFRSHGAEVVHVRVAELTDDSRDVAPKQLLRGLIVPSISQEAKFLESVAPEGDELIFSKSSSGMFPATNADRIFRNLGIDTLVMCGTSTGGCVESAAREAIDLGYKVIIVEDACASSTPTDHQAALDRMRGPTCWDTESTDVINALRSSLPRQREAVAGTERVKQYLPKRPEDAPPDVDPYKLIFPPPKSVELGPTDSALLLLDATRLFIDRHSPLLSAASGASDDSATDRYLARATIAVANMARLVEAAHHAGVRTLHLRTAGRTPDGVDLAPAMRAILGTLPSTHPFALQAEPIPQPDSLLLLSKPGQSPFVGTGLDELLRHMGIRKLLLCGLSLSGAVEGALRGATDRGYQVLLAPDACAAATQNGQERLGQMGAGLIEVTTADDAVARLTFAK